MSTITQIIRDSKEESKKIFQSKCQRKIEAYERRMMKRKKRCICQHCNENCTHILKGKRNRNLRTSNGVLTFKIQQVKCKNCNKTYRPLIKWLGLEKRQRITEEFLDKSIVVAIYTSYKTASKITENLTGEKITSRRIQNAILEKSEKIRREKANKPSKKYIVMCEDSTKVKTGRTKRGDDINIVYGITGRELKVNKKTGEIKRRLLKGEILSIVVGNKKSVKIQHTTRNVMSDGAGTVKKKNKYTNEKVEDVVFHRCNWHLSRMLGFALYNDGLKTKKERIPFVSKLALIIKFSFNNYRQYYKDLINELKEKQYYKAVKYLQNAEQEFYNTKEKPIMIDGIPLLSNSPVERVMREIDRRVDIGVRWSQKGVEAITRVRLNYIYTNY